MNRKRSVTDTTTYKFYENLKLDKMIMSNLEASMEIEPEDIKEELSKIKKYKLAGTSNVINAFIKGDYKLIYSKKSTDLIPTSMSTFHLASKPPMVDITHISKLDDKGNIVIDDERKLYALMVSGYIVYKSYTQWSNITKNKVIRTNGSIIYSTLIGNVIKRSHSVDDKLDRIKLDYLLSRFYLEYMLGLDSEVAHEQILKDTHRNNIPAISMFSKKIKPDTFSNFETFFNELKIQIGGLGGFRIKELYEGVLKQYGTSAVFIVDNFDYMAINIAYAACGSFLNKQYAMESVIDKHGGGFYIELMRL